MEINSLSSFSKRHKADLLVLPYWKGKKHAEPAFSHAHLPKVTGPIDCHDFKGSEGDIALLYFDDEPEKRIALLGLGEQSKATIDKLRAAYAKIADLSQKRKIKEINISLPDNCPLDEDEVVRGVIEGLYLANYAYLSLKNESLKEDSGVLISKVHLHGAKNLSPDTLKKYQTIFEGVYLARDLVNGNADDVTPQYFIHVAKDLAAKYPKIKTTILDRKHIEKEKLGLLLAVNRGSHRDPALIICEYRGNPKSKDVTAIVGKGVTYDTGGLNLKGTGNMETMKCDMGGAATVFGTLLAAAKLGLHVNLIGVVPTTENAISGASYKPGDVYTSYSGKTVEIGNTDAEGRLILADALSYLVKNYKPSRIIDFATLTGAIEIALGPDYSGLFSNDADLIKQLQAASVETSEKIWNMPMPEEYREFLKSDIADIKNIGGRPGGSITAALFLQEFVEKTPWAHLDIAATAFLNSARRYQPKCATGVGVRLMIQFLEKFAQ